MGALRAAVRSYDGRGPQSSLEAAVLAHLGIAGLDDLLERLHVQGASRSEIAALAPAVIDAVRAGDEAAGALVTAAAGELADSIRAVAVKLGWQDDPVEVALVGGLFAAGPILREPLTRAVAAQLPAARLVTADAPPPAGACLRARDLCRPP